MTKGIKRELTIEEEIVELDHLLLAALRRNLGLAERLRKSLPDEKGRALLEKHQSRHVLNGKKNQEAVSQAPATESEADKRIRRFDRYLAGLPETDLQNVLDLVKSMHRSRKPARPGKPQRGNGSRVEGGEGEGVPGT
jgi:hypothetical protein